MPSAKTPRWLRRCSACPPNGGVGRQDRAHRRQAVLPEGQDPSQVVADGTHPRSYFSVSNGSAVAVVSILDKESLLLELTGWWCEVRR